MSLLRVYRGERGLVFGAAAIVFALEAGEALAGNAGDALYLARVGARGLGAQLALSSVLLVVTLGIVGTLADRSERARFLAALAAGGAALLLGLRGALELWPASTPAVLLVLSKQLAAAVDLAFWVLLADRLDARQSRRLVPVVVVAGGAGLVGGSFSTHALAAALGLPGVLAAGAAAYAIAAVIALGLSRRRVVAVGAALGEVAARPASMLRAWREGVGATRRSELARRLAIVVAIAGALGPILYYALGAAAAARYPGEAELAGFYGRYRGIVNLVTLAAQGLLMPIVLRRAGVGQALLLAPVVALAAGVALAVRLDLAIAAAAQAALRLLDAAVETPAEKLAQNLLGRDVRGRVGAFLDGVAKRIGAVVGGLAIALVAGVPRAIGVMAALVAAAWILAATALRRRYPALAVDELATRGAGASFGDPELTPVLDEATLRMLARDLGGADATRRDIAVEALARTRPDLAVVELARAARQPDAARGPLLAALDRLITERATARADDDVTALLTDFLAGDDADARVRIVRAAGALLGEDAFTRARPLLQRAAADDRADAVRVAARLVLARRAGEDSAFHALVEETLGLSVAARDAAALALLGGSAAARATPVVAADRDSRAIALRLLADAAMGDPARAVALLVRVATAAPVTERIAAFHALAIALPHAGDPADAIAAARAGIEDPLAPPALRLAATELVAALATPALAGELARRLGDADEQVRAAAAGGLARIGIGALPVLLVAARFGRRAARDAALEVLRDLRAPPAALDDVIDVELAEIHTAHLRRAALVPATNGDRAAALLALRLEDRARERARTLLLVVEVRTGDRRVGAAADRALDARDPRARARALEALDAILPRALARRIVETLDDAPVEERAARAAAALAIPVPDAATAARDELDGDDPLARALVVHTLGAGGRQANREAIRAAAHRGAVDLDPLRLLRRLAEPDANHPATEESDVPSSVETMVALRGVPLFAELTSRQLADLATALVVEDHAAGATILREGEPGDSLYVIHSGQVAVDSTILAPGASFGELALLDAAPATPHITAVERTRLGRLSRDAFQRIVEDSPSIALSMCRVLARRR